MSLEKFGKYEVVEKIGEGGFGEVFKGRDPQLKRFVAIKTCKASDPGLVERFLREAEIVASLQHPNITTVFDFGHQEGTPYLVQEYLSGEDLDRKINRLDPIPLETRVRYLAEVARGLRYAHAQGVIHRDIKPSNLRVLDDGRVKIMDFGIAKLLGAERNLTQTGMAMGTTGYLPPEQLRGEDVDLRADVFSFGVAAYELFGARRPFEGDSFASICHQILHVEPPRLSELQCPPSLAEMVARCLRKNPAERFASFDEVLLVLEGEITAPGPAGVETTTVPDPYGPTMPLPRSTEVPRTAAITPSTKPSVSGSAPWVAPAETEDELHSFGRQDTPPPTSSAGGSAWWRGLAVAAVAAVVALAALIVFGLWDLRSGQVSNEVPVESTTKVSKGTDGSSSIETPPPALGGNANLPVGHQGPTFREPLHSTLSEPPPSASSNPRPSERPLSNPRLPTPLPATTQPSAPRIPFPLNPDEKPIPVAVLPLGLARATRDIYPQLAERQVGFGVHNMLVNRLFDTGWFRFVEAQPEVVEDLVKRHWMAATGTISKNSAVNLGRVLGARYVVYGEVFDFGIQRLRRKKSETRIAIQVRLVDVETFEFVPASGKSTIQRKGTVFPGSAELTVGAVTEAALEKAVQQLINRVTP
jgi:serine/threonine protein kinase